MIMNVLLTPLPSFFFFFSFFRHVPFFSSILKTEKIKETGPHAGYVSRRLKSFRLRGTNDL